MAAALITVPTVQNIRVKRVLGGVSAHVQSYYLLRYSTFQDKPILSAWRCRAKGEKKLPFAV